AQESLISIGDTARKINPFGAELFWTRWEVSVALTPNFDIDQLRALNRSTAYAELTEGQPLNVGVPDRRIAAVEAKVDAGTASLIVNVGTRSVEGFEG
ncbi:hypothetical protein LCGC14_2670750, partial [marine sediment metagenome]